jgi:nicotinate-nucleotide adenylyltransferase
MLSSVKKNRSVDFLHRAPGAPSHIGILAGAFNPVTVAHAALARAALARVDQVVFVLPREFPHKEYFGPGLEARAALLLALAAGSACYSVACADGGLFIEIARECRAAYGGSVRVSMLCGRDAAERIVDWDYGEPGAIERMLAEFSLLVAARRGEYSPPPSLAHAIRRLELDGEFDHVSASEVRRRIAAGMPWEHLVPAAVRDQVRRLYR